MKTRLAPKQSESVQRIAGLIIINAMIFQEVLAKDKEEVRPLGRFKGKPDVVGSLAEHWQYILDEINYYPIFHVAHQLLSDLAADADVTKEIDSLIEVALQVVGWRAALRHDLAGRIYHQLLSEAKHLGAYYTSIPAATLLLKLALQPEGYDCDWHDVEAIREFRIADLACGTGTLLMAAAETVLDNYYRACAQKGQPPDADLAHSVLVENAIWGFDVLPSALHLTASTLSLRVPDLPINVTNLYNFSLGGRRKSLGSLEFLEASEVTTSRSLFGDHSSPERVEGRGSKARNKVKVPMLDLCVMNPPFVRSVGGNLLFGNLPARERAATQKRLQDVVRKQNARASITAGLGAVFTATGHRYVKPGGRIALVLPRGLLSGVAWKETRHLIGQFYDLEHIIVSHEVNHWNFSENTDLSETLIIARKRIMGERGPEQRVCCSNLWRQPVNAVEALSLASSVAAASHPDLSAGQGATPLLIGSRKVGEAVSVPWSHLRQGPWSFPCSFAQVELNRAVRNLLDGTLVLPADNGTADVALVPLARFGRLGFDCRDMHDAFAISEAATPYQAFWNHATDDVDCLKQFPNRYLMPLAEPKPGRPLRKATDMWKRAGTLLLSERLRLNKARLVAVRTTAKVVSNVWWTFVPTLKTRQSDLEKALVLWLNSSLGLLLLLAHREETEGAWVKFKKPVLQQMLVPDFQDACAEPASKLATAYTHLRSSGLHSLPAIAGDDTRARIDEAVQEALGLPDLSILRELLSREPIICLTNERLMPSG